MKKMAPVQVQPVFKTLPAPDAAPATSPGIYRVARANPEAFADPAPPLDPQAAPWRDLPVAAVAHFHPDSAPDHRPRTDVRLLHAGDRLRALFDVHDRFVRCVHAEYQSMVSRDSCVELFLQPPGASGYFNFEFSCGGAMMVFYIEDPRRAGDRLFAKYQPVPERLGRAVSVWSSLRHPIDPEVTTPVRWQLACEIPFAVLRPYLAPAIRQFAGTWRGNFFKCADGTSRPHWAAWNPIGSVLRFHQPDKFGSVVFED